MPKKIKPEDVLTEIRESCIADVPTLDKERFGVAMKSLRNSEGKKLREVAKATGLSTAMICYFEKGLKMITKDKQLLYVKECLK